MAKDAEDESLRRYKEQLLGAAAKGNVEVDPNDKRRVVITELRMSLLVLCLLFGTGGAVRLVLHPTHWQHL
jgi:hypothetical protein